MRSKRQKEIAALLNRYLFIDFARAVAVPRSRRKTWLREYVERPIGNWPSHKGFRSQITNIMGVARGLDPSEALTIDEIEKNLKLVCDPKHLGSNVELAHALFNYVRPKGWLAYSDHPQRTLLMARDRNIPIGVQHYIVDGERGAFQFVYTRSAELDGAILNTCLSLMYYNHVSEDMDFGEFDVEIIDLSRPTEVGPRGGQHSAKYRKPRIHRLDMSDLVSREELAEEANLIYQILMELAAEAGPGTTA